ncbi:MAG: non-ribosomal peptide synthetase [Clostridia bacterium]|nr:non-ribosomal peptide synthetase [Clostridia bacterium]
MFRTLREVIKSKEGVHNKGITFITEFNYEKFLSYHDFYIKVSALSAALLKAGIKKGDEVVLQTENTEHFLLCFWASILNGMIPVPVASGGTAEHEKKLLGILNFLMRPVIIASEKSLRKLEKFKNTATFAAENELNNQEIEILNIEKLLEDGKNQEDFSSLYSCRPDEIAFVQFSSGSTGEPKGVVLTHANVLANLESIREGAQVNETDSYLTWMPMFHDMGLIGFHLLPVFCGINHYIMPTELFIRNPMFWMEKAGQHRITTLGSPNFGYKYFLSRYAPDTEKNWDLSCIRMIYNGAEPIHHKLCQHFLNTLSRYELKKEAMFPVYGLAEATVGVAFPIPGKEYETVHIHRDSLKIGNIIKEVESNHKNCSTYVVEGRVLKNCQVKICDEKGKDLGERMLGRILIKGKNVSQGYYRYPEATRKTVDCDGWVDTGDLGFYRNDQLVVTGRSKDIIIVNGQNIYPYDVERAAGEIIDLPFGQTIACGVYDPENETESIILFITFKKDIKDFLPIAAKVKSEVWERMGIQIKDVLPIAKIPKTTSGKVQRYKLSRRYVQGDFNKVIHQLDLKIRTLENSTWTLQGGVEETLSEIFKKATKRESINPTEDISSYISGSLMLAALQNEIENVFPHVLLLPDFYKYPTLRKLAERIEEATGRVLETEKRQNQLSDLYTIKRVESAKESIPGLSCDEAEKSTQMTKGVNESMFILGWETEKIARLINKLKVQEVEVMEVSTPDKGCTNDFSPSGFMKSDLVTFIEAGMKKEKIHVKGENVYLITCGLDITGIKISRLLWSFNPTIHLIFTDRSFIPTSTVISKNIPRAEKFGEKVAALSQMKSQGMKIYPYCADATSEEDFTKVLEDVYKKFEKINGIIHSTDYALS